MSYTRSEIRIRRALQAFAALTNEEALDVINQLLRTESEQVRLDLATEFDHTLEDWWTSNLSDYKDMIPF